MKRNFTMMRNAVSVFLVFLLPYFINGQTKLQKQKIISNYDLVKSDSLIDSFEKEHLNRQKRINEYLKNHNKEGLSKSEIFSIRDITPDGIPLFYKSHNLGSAITIRANTLYTGGDLGLDLSGNSMTAGMWEAENGFPLTSHTDLTGRITIIDGGSSVNFHATHVAGTIMSSGASTFDNTGRGIAYEASLLAADSANDTSEMTFQASTGLLVSNHSYGYGVNGLPIWTFGAYNSDASSLDVIVNTHPYYLPVISAGNDRDDFADINPTKNGYDLLTGMSNAKNGITSAAVFGVSDYTGPFSVFMSSFSNWGPSDDGRIKPDISSKGVSVYSTSNTSITSYSNSNGTSMSAPAITGLLLLLQEHYNNINANFMLSATAKGILLHTADEAGLYPGPDYQFGWGLANGKKAAETISNSSTTSSFIEEASLNNTDLRTFSIKATGSEPLMVSISWTDPAAFPVFNSLDDTTPKLVNDLDIILSKDGTNYYPWKLDPANPALGATRNSTNDVDNFEKIEIDNPNVDDIYTVTINHKGTLSGGSQNYSLIITGGSLENLSVSEENLDFSNLKLYPNPNKGEFTVDFNSVSNNDVEIEVYDISGRKVYNNIYSNVESRFNETVSLLNVQSGVYIMNVTQGSSTTSRKLIIE